MEARIAIFRSLESICYLYQIFSVVRLKQRLCQSKQLLFVNESSLESDLFNTGNVQTLSLLESRHKICRIQKGIMIAGIQPCKASSQCLYL